MLKKKGIDNFEMAISNSKVLSAQTRNVKLENIESSSGISITLNVIIGKKQATLNANNIEGVDAREFLDKGKFMAESSPEDPFSGLPEVSEYATNIKDLDLSRVFLIASSNRLARLCTIPIQFADTSI